ncbi:MAG: acyl-[ACP]--phospholipid O-acyltransferase [Elusimicrobia bacterium]|nr:MAG: acyl-[ACP]--phospholipid O-acyltransferase [Elusimicrobiota bacterium]
MANSAALRQDVGSSGFQALLWTQGFGAFNDNAFKTLIALWAVSQLPAQRSSALIALAGGMFVAPFILFSTTAGAVADRHAKKRLIVLFKAVELGLMIATTAALYWVNIPFLLFLLVLMGAQSAFFGPAKLAILPEILDDASLSHGNGLMQMTTFGAILVGTIAAGFMIETMVDTLYYAGFVFVAVSGLGLAVSLKIPETPAREGVEPLRWNIFGQAAANFRTVAGHRGVLLALAGTAYFWFVAAVLQMNLLVYGKQLMQLSETWLSLFQVAVAVGIGAGSFIAGKLSREQVELGLVPAGAMGLVVFSLGLAFSFHSTGATLWMLILLGASAGCFAVPLMAFVQQRAPDDERGKFIAMGNLFSFSAILIASGCLWAFSDIFRLHPGQIFLVLSIMTIVVASFITAKLPDFLLRLMLYPIANIVYRIQVDGGTNIPLRGPALLVANHVSHIDAFLIAASARRMVRFLMYKPYYDHWFMNPICRAMGAIPISETDGAKEIVRSLARAADALRAGEIVCIFAEGQVTRHGQMLRFKKGFERILRGVDNASIIPVHLDRVWGSIFSFERDRFFFKTPRRLPYPITVTFGSPMPGNSKVHEVRQRVIEIGSEAFRHRLSEKTHLGASFLFEAKRHWRRFAIADSTGQELTYGSALVRSLLLKRAIQLRLPGHKPVGILLPPTAAGALANIAVAAAGRTSVNINYTVSEEIAHACAEKAEVAAIITSKKFLEKVGWRQAPNMVLIEDLAASISKPGAALTYLLCRVLPSFLLESLFMSRSPGLEDTATIIFTSGSTGTPKGAMLSHSNIHSNIEALGQLYKMDGSDRLLGVLPFFHSFGYTGCLWFPLVAGFGVVYHFNPLDAKRIGVLVKKFQATLLLGTPTFLQSYVKRIEADQFRSLRYVIAGAEKLRQNVAEAFEEKFGVLPLEGYGTTELSPVAAINIPDFVKKGGRQQGTKMGSVGHPVPGVLMKIVDPDSGEELPLDKPGLLLVKGPNVMKGYLKDKEKTREVMRGDYYVTGDIAKIDEDGFVTITDRLSRFSKVAGEMVPHIRVEESLQEAAGLVERTFVVTGVPDERKGEKLVVLHTSVDDLDGVYKRFQESGLPNLWHPSRSAFREVEEFPLLGSGKLDLQALKKVAAS